jgi:hypothetical protein
MEGRMREFHPEWNGRTNVLLEYDATDPNGSGDLALTDGLELEACMVGGLLVSWVGGANQMVEFFESALAGGTHLRDETKDGVSCHVIEWTRPRRVDTLFVDREGLLPIRWDSVQTSNDGNTVRRERTYSRFSQCTENCETFESNLVRACANLSDLVADAGAGAAGMTVQETK